MAKAERPPEPEFEEVDEDLLGDDPPDEDDAR